jgi:hypothetical protein
MLCPTIIDRVCSGNKRFALSLAAKMEAAMIREEHLLRLLAHQL